MAQYAERWEEFEKGIAAVQQKDIDPAKDEIEILPVLTRYTGFTNSMQKYMDWRDKALNSALPILKNESTSITGAAQKDKWDDHFAKQGQEALKMILSFVPDDDKTPKLRLFAEAMATQESAFFAKLCSVPLPWFQGQVQEYTYQFYKEMNSLEGKWKKLVYDDKSIDAQVQKISKEILSLFGKIVKEIIDEERKIENLIHNSPPTAPLGPITTLISAIRLGVTHILNKTHEMKKSLDYYVKDLLYLYKSEETVVILFNKGRTGVKEFLEKTNLDTATDEFEETCKNSLGIASQCKTKGQQDDAKRFVETAIPIVKDFFAEFKNQYEEFIDENEEIFVGPVGDKSIEEILEVRNKQQSWDEIVRFNVQRKLKDLHSDAAASWKIGLDGLTDEEKRDIEYMLKGDLERLSRGLVAASDDTAFDRLGRYYSETTSKLKNLIQSSRGGLQ